MAPSWHHPTTPQHPTLFWQQQIADCIAAICSNTLACQKFIHGTLKQHPVSNSRNGGKLQNLARVAATSKMGSRLIRPEAPCINPAWQHSVAACGSIFSTNVALAPAPCSILSQHRYVLESEAQTPIALSVSGKGKTWNVSWHSCVGSRICA